jgi:hypothetical protein
MLNRRFPRTFRWLVAIAGATSVITLAAATPGRSRPSRSDFYAFGGRVIPADGGSLDRVHVVAVDARGSYEALIDSSGIFVGAFAAPPVGRVTLRVFSDSTSPRYHSSVITLGPGVPATPARVVLVPTTWHIQGGAFDGRDVRVDPVRATTRSGDGPGYWRLTRRGSLAGRAVTWSTTACRFASRFATSAADPPITTSDSVRFWERAMEVERLIGRSLFRPASFEDVEAGGDGILVTIDRRMSAAGRTFITYDQGGRIYEALVTVSAARVSGRVACRDARADARDRFWAHRRVALRHGREHGAINSPSGRRRGVRAALLRDRQAAARARGAVRDPGGGPIAGRQSGNGNWGQTRFSSFCCGAGITGRGRISDPRPASATNEKGRLRG